MTRLLGLPRVVEPDTVGAVLVPVTGDRLPRLIAGWGEAQADIGRAWGQLVIE